MIGRKWMVATLLLLNQLGLILAYDYTLLKKCKDSGFCLRNREYAQKIEASKNAYYSIDGSSVVYEAQNHTIKCNVIKRIPHNGGEDGRVVLPFTVDMLEGSKVRFVLDEERSVHGVPEILATERSNTAMEFAFEYPEKQVGRSGGDIEVKKPDTSEKDKITIEDHGSQVRVVLYLNKFLIQVYHKDVLQITVNERSYLNLEHWRPKDQQDANLLPEESTFDMFEDSFVPPSNDTKPFGPEAVALDITFHNYQNVYGIPDHANSLRLKDTSSGDPYRLYNADLAEYELNATYPLYGSIPFMISARPGAAAGVFWVNAADTFVDVKYEGKDARTHWMSEAGKIDVVLFFGDVPAEVTELYTGLTGRPALPQFSALGYHQSRWNYNDEQDVLTVVHEMNKAEIPMDYVWLDLDYTDERKYFTWKPDAFPDPFRLYKKVEDLAKNLVILIDPHLKVDYNISNLLLEHNGLMLDHTGAPLQAQCWPGESVWVDSVSPAGRDTWASLYVNYLEGVKNLAIWNDMNEPAVFDGTESTARKDVILGGGYELRALHNLYGMSVHEATYKGLKQRYGEDGLRPFLLTRAHFAGSQRTAGTWTGDNGATWGYLSISIPMVLSSNIVGMPMNGVDIGGFFHNPEPELLARWYQTAVWYPFFRGHANKGTNRREPFLAQEPYKSVIRDAINLRYSLLPTFYTAFHDSNTTGIPIMNPMFYVKPELEEVYSIQDQFYLGQQGILVKPVVSNNTDSVDFYFPPGIFYDYKTFEPSVFQAGTYKKVHAPLDSIPIFLEGGHIITRKNRHRQSTKLMKNDPYTLVVAPNEAGKASGDLYIDDGETFSYRDGNYLKINYNLRPGSLIGKIINVSDQFGGVGIEQIIIAKHDQIKLGGSVIVEQDGQKWTVTPIENEHYYSIPHPNLVVDKEWEITF